MVWDFAGGILGALQVLKDHWGPVERDFAAAHWSMDDFLDVMPLSAFIAFVLYSPPGTAVFHLLHEGWDANTHKLTDLIEWVKMLICTKFEDPEAAYESLGREKRAGVEQPPDEPKMTIGDYMKLAGLEGGDE